MSACPARCGRQVRLGNLLCAPCWHAVPQQLQADVWRAWRALQKERGSIERVAEYKRAADAATTAARKKLVEREFAL